MNALPGMFIRFPLSDVGNRDWILIVDVRNNHAVTFSPETSLPFTRWSLNFVGTYYELRVDYE